MSAYVQEYRVLQVVKVDDWGHLLYINAACEQVGASMSGGMVAEKKHTCMFGGMVLKMSAQLGAIRALLLEV